MQDDRGDPASLLEALQLVSTQAHRAAEIVRQIRDFIRKRDPDRGPVDVNELVRQTAVLVSPEARKAGVDLDLDLAATLPPVTGTAVELEQVIINLVRNAIDAVGRNPPGERQVKVHSKNGMQGELHLEVLDNGPGIDETTARGLLTYAFAADVINRISSAPVRDYHSVVIQYANKTGGIAPGRAIEALGSGCCDNHKRRRFNKRSIFFGNMIDFFLQRALWRFAVDLFERVESRDQVSIGLR